MDVLLLRIHADCGGGELSQRAGAIIEEFADLEGALRSRELTVSRASCRPESSSTKTKRVTSRRSETLAFETNATRLKQHDEFRHHPPVETVAIAREMHGHIVLRDLGMLYSVYQTQQAHLY
jgi:hypothetical protein